MDLEKWHKENDQFERATPLMKASRQGDTQEILRLIKAGANLEETDIHGHTVLCRACRGGHIDVILVLLNAGANVHHEDSEFWTPLHHACWHCHSVGIGAIIALIKYGAYVTKPDIAGWTPFMKVIVHGNQEFLEVLLRAGAKPQGRSNSDKTVVDIAQEHNPSLKPFLESLLPKS